MAKKRPQLTAERFHFMQNHQINRLFITTLDCTIHNKNNRLHKSKSSVAILLIRFCFMVLIQITRPTTVYVQCDKNQKISISSRSQILFRFFLKLSPEWNFKVNKVTCFILNDLFWLLLKLLSDVDDIPINSKHLMNILNTGVSFVCAHFKHQTKLILSSSSSSFLYISIGLWSLEFYGRENWIFYFQSDLWSILQF